MRPIHQELTPEQKIELAHALIEEAKHGVPTSSLHYTRLEKLDAIISCIQPDIERFRKQAGERIANASKPKVPVYGVMPLR